MFFFKCFATLCISLSCLATNVAGDSHENCVAWAKSGECDANPDYMLENCKTACEKYGVIDFSPIDGVDSFFDLKARDINGDLVDFNKFRGQVTVIVNVASFCGYTESHYDGLVKLHREVSETGLVNILAFPCNQFGHQEPEGPEWIKSFAKSKGVEFTMMEKIDVNGPETHPVYLYLKKSTPVRHISWNFATYYLVSPNGMVLPFSGVEPSDLKDAIFDILEAEAEL